MAKNLQDEIKQKKPFPSIEDEAALSIVRTADILVYDVAPLFKAKGITGTQYNVLRILRGSLEEGLPCQEVGKRMITKVPDVTRLLDRLEQQGLIRRERQLDDRRVVKAWILDKGLKLLAELDGPTTEFNAGRLAHIGKERLEVLLAILADIRKGP